jgi:hypothetical protein
MDAYIQFSIQKEEKGFLLLTEAGVYGEKDRQPGLLMLLPTAELLKHRLMSLWRDAVSVAAENEELEALRTNLCMRHGEDDPEVINLCRELTLMIVETKTGEVMHDVTRLQ